MHADSPVEKQDVEANRVAHRLKEALESLPKASAPAEKGLKPKLKERQGLKNSLLERLVLKSFLNDIVFGTKEELAIGEKFDGFNDIYREMVMGKKSLWKPFHEIVSKKIAIPLAAGKENQSIIGYHFSKESKAKEKDTSKEKPLALILTGSFSASENYAAPLVTSYLEEGFDVLVVDPVGFGESQAAGSPNPENFLASAEAAAKYVHSELKVPNKNVVLHGYSLGGLAAAHVASLKENRGMHLVLDRCPASSQAEAEKFMKLTLPLLIGSVAAATAGKIVESCVPYDLEKLLPKIKGNVFIAQADLANGEATNSKLRNKGSSAYALVEKLERAHKLDKVAITKSLEEGEHVTDYSETWMRKTVSKTNQDFRVWLHKLSS